MLTTIYQIIIVIKKKRRRNNLSNITEHKKHKEISTLWEFFVSFIWWMNFHKNIKRASPTK